MLAKVYRLKNFRLESPKQIRSKNFSLKIAKNNVGVTRFAFVVSKRIDKRSVVRNRLKRLVRSCIEEIFDKIEKGHDFITYPKKESVQRTRSEILEEMKTLLNKEQLLK